MMGSEGRERSKAARPWRTVKAKSKNVWWIWEHTGNQWRVVGTDVTWSERRVREMVLAAVF